MQKRRLSGESGDIPGWVLILLMSSALVIGIWSVAGPKLQGIVENALNAVCGPLPC